MRRVILITLACFGTISFYAQEAEPYKNTVSLDALSFVTRTISVSYTYKLSNRYEIRINPKVSFSGRDDNMVAGLFTIEDPYWYYNTYGLHIGLSRRIYKMLYVEPIIYYKYGSFNSKELKISDSEGDQFDEYQTLSRNYNSGGMALQSGLIADKGHFRFNFYYGLGYHLRYYNQNILEKRYWNTPIPDNYPIKSNYWKDGISVHLGIRLGFRI